MIRDDLSNKLIHLVCGDTDQQAFDVFNSILNERQFRGGNGCIRGGFKCVCFSETPISKLGYILSNPMAHGIRYKPFGFMVDKSWLFERGGRPVIYQSHDEYSQLPPDLQYRHVTYEPNNPSGPIDFTWEREWRIKTDALPFTPDEVTVIYPKRTWAEGYKGSHLSKMSATVKSLGEIGIAAMKAFPWHYIVLEDLGVIINDGL
jgi:hypothetical protein